MKDFDGLKVELETEARYASALPAKSLQPLMALLNEDEPGTEVWLDTTVSDVMEAAGQAKLAALTANDRGRFGVLNDNGKVATSRPQIRAELISVFGINENQLAAGIPGVRRLATYGEAFGFERTRKEDLWKILPQIPASHMAAMRAAADASYAAATQAAADAKAERALKKAEAAANG